MNVLIMINNASKAPATLDKLLKGVEVQPIEIDEFMEEDDISSLKSYINALCAEHVYILYNNSDEELQSLKAIKESNIKIDAFFTCF